MTYWSKIFFRRFNPPQSRLKLSQGMYSFSWELPCSCLEASDHFAQVARLYNLFAVLMLRLIRRTRRSLDTEPAKTLVHALVTSRVDSCNAVLSALDSVFNAIIMDARSA